jgi:type I restriction-modification system DNA methylase subunit
MDAAEYKHVVLGLIFLKYISDAFQEVYDKLDAEEYADPEDRDEYTAESRRTRDGLVICRFTDRSLTRRRGSCAR